jgi:Zn-dependent peptidase ImmA (M78 family)
MKLLARQVRAEFNLLTPQVRKSDLRRIYKKHNIHIYLWPYKFQKLRGAYFNDEYGVTVMLDSSLPDDPLIFTMAHELKHHLVDGELRLSYCGSNNESEPIEIGAEIFAAELIFPEQDFATRLIAMGVRYGGCKPEHLVKLKHDTKTTLSYAGLAKRAEFMRFATDDVFKKARWKKLDEEIYGVPIYKIIRQRRNYKT